MGGMSGMHAGHQTPQGGAGAGMASGGMAGMDVAAMDLNDIEFDAYLANYRTLEDPEVHAVERGGRVRLRLINASAGTNYFEPRRVCRRLNCVRHAAMAGSLFSAW